MSAERKLGEWRLEREIDRTTHSIVWWATGGDGRNAAVKELRDRKPEKEAYKRFGDEVKLLRDLGDFPGVLPLLDGHVPEKPTSADPAWLAMPLAVTLPAHLGAETTLKQVVEAVAVCAHTLATLAENGIFHRDVKPNNLFWLNKEPLVGDFGIATWPGKQALTADDKKLGPAHFIAPEMINTPASAEPGPADVYSLAKTVWALAVGNAFPPPGQLRPDEPATALRGYVKDGRAAQLEPILELATEFKPSRRPSMQAFAEELDAWLRPRATTDATPPSLEDVASRIRAITEPARRAEGDREGRERQMELLFEPLLERGLKSLYAPMSELGRVLMEDQGLLLWGMQQGTGRRDGGSTMSVSLILIPHGAHNVSMTAEVAYELHDETDVRLVAGYHYPIDRGLREMLWVDVRDVLLGTQGAEQAVDDLIQGLADNLRLAALMFSDLLEQAETRAQEGRQAELTVEGDTVIFTTDPRPGHVLVHAKTDGKFQGGAVAWIGAQLREIRADGDRLYVRSDKNEGWITKNVKGNWVLSDSKAVDSTEP